MRVRRAVWLSLPAIAALIVALAVRGSRTELSQQLAPAARPSVGDLLRRVDHTYTTAAIYSDTGVIRRPDDTLLRWATRFLLHRGDDTFETDFHRDGAAMFTFRAFDPHVVRRDGTGVWLKTPDTQYRVSSFSEGLGHLAGVTRGTSMMVPGLLLSDPRRLTRSMTGVRYGRDESVDGRACYTVTGTDGTGRQYTLSLDRQSLLLRRLIVRNSGTTDIHIHYKPTLGIPKHERAR